MSSISPPPNPFLAAAAGWRLPALDEIFFLPGDWAVYALATHAPSLAAILGVGSADYGGLYAGVLSLWFWLLLSLVLVMAAAAVRSFDRALTFRIAMLYADLEYRVRVWRQLAVHRRRVAQRVEPTCSEQSR